MARAVGRLKFVVRALEHRNYRLFFIGQMVSMVGTWLTSVATYWLVYRLAREAGRSDSEIMLGVAFFASQIPVFVLGPLAGAAVDRWDRHRVLLVTQFASMLQSFALAALALTHHVQIWHILMLNLGQGVINAFDLPARQAFVVEMVEDRKDLTNAIALNSSVVHLARFVGPPLAGLIITLSGEGTCFLIDGFSFLAVLLALMSMRLGERRPVHAGKLLQVLREGVIYSWKTRAIRNLLFFAAATSLVIMPQSVLMPAYAASVLHGDAGTFGLITGCSGVGAFIGGVYLASRRSVIGLGRVVLYALCAMAISLTALAFSRSPWTAFPAAACGGLSMVVSVASLNTLLQTIVDDDMRGRVMSLFTMAFIGVAPFGSLLAGWIAARIGVSRTFLVSGASAGLVALVFAIRLPRLRHHIRPIYQRKGILPQSTEAVGTAAALAGHGID